MMVGTSPQLMLRIGTSVEKITRKDTFINNKYHTLKNAF